MRISQAQLRLLKWLGGRKNGSTVTELAKHLGTSVQSAHVRLNDARERRWVVRKDESNGSRSSYRYLISASGKKVAAKKWQKANKRFLISAG